ncbi:sensor histidine kinase [Dinghuibacter silviterrae]|nr:histidine kinase [Dinghuibacter silviterrae]
MLLPVCAGTIAQTEDESRFTRYTRVDGLSGNTITSIVQDSIGYIWIGTDRGLDRFDGRFFQCYYPFAQEFPLPDNWISGISLRGREIIGSTPSGVFVFDFVTHRGRQLIVPCDSSIFYWTNNAWDALVDGTGHYVVSTFTGLYVFDTSGKLFRRYDFYRPSDVGRTEIWVGGPLYPLANGTILQYSDSGYCAYDPSTAQIDDAYELNHYAFRKAVTDGKGAPRVCLAGKSGQLFVINGDKNTLDLYDPRNGSVQSIPLPIPGSPGLGEAFFLNDSLLAIMGRVTGFYLLRYDASVHRLSLASPRLFEDKQCTRVFQDRDGRLWVGTKNGLYKENLSSPLFRVDDLSLQEPALKDFPIRTVSGDRTRLFVGLRNKGGVLVLDKASRKILRHIYPGPREDSCNNISFFYPYSRDTLWVGSQVGLFWLNLRDYRCGRVPLPPGLAWTHHENCLAILEDSRGIIWITFRKFNSLIHFDRSTREWGEVPLRENPLLRITFCISMAEDLQGNIWLAGDGLCRWNRTKGRVDTLIPYPPGMRLKNFMMIFDRDRDNHLWLLSPSNGIVRFNCTDGRMVLQKTDEDLGGGGSSPVIRGRIWMGGYSGIAAFDTRDNSIRTFTYADGLPMVPITTIRKGSWYDSREDRFYLGSLHQLISFIPDIPPTRQPPPVFLIDQITTSRGNYPADAGRIALPFAGNFAQLSFNAVHFSTPEEESFSYRVLPATDTSWHLLSSVRSVHFSNLSPGEYRIQVKLSAVDNRWPEQVKEVRLVVFPPFWARWWFVTLGILALAGGVYVFYRGRLRRIREKLVLDKKIAEYEMKALHAQMNPHFIFNALNSIREMILQDDNHNASRYLTRFARLIRLTLEHSRQTFITMRQNNEYLEGYLEMERLRFADFSYNIEVSGRINEDELRVAPMLIQPLVENAIWHGLKPKDGSGQLSIRFYLDNDQLVCEIEDNGIGIRESLRNKEHGQVPHRSMGIANIRQRIAVLNEKYKMNCQLHIQDRNDVDGRNGTLVTLVLPADEETPILHEHD